MLVPLKTLLVLEEQRAFLRLIYREAERYDFQIQHCHGAEEAALLIEDLAPGYALVDLGKSQQESLKVVERLLRANPDCKCVVTSAYGNISAAVSSIKAGAIDYIPKPTTADRIISALMGQTTEVPLELKLMRPDRLYWEYLHTVLKGNDYNISRSAKKLKLHRRSLQRILNKRAPAEQFA